MAKTATDLRQRRLTAIVREHEAIMRAGQAVGRKLAGLLETWDDPVVLVRGYGTPWRFHSKDAPCGHVQIRSNFIELPVSEARAKGLSACPACASLI